LVKFLRAIDQFIYKFCSYVLVIAICTILFLSLFNIGLRWGGMTWLWVEPLARHLVFFCAFLGATIAVGHGQHISIDLLGRLLEHLEQKNMQRWIAIVTDLACIGVCGCLTYAGIRFAEMEFAAGTKAFLGVQSGFLVAMIPFGMGLIAYRFFYRTVARIAGEI
jgi:TRAP-type C4-dicarboxylate transport system permease small subunit